MSVTANDITSKAEPLRRLYGIAAVDDGYDRIKVCTYHNGYDTSSQGLAPRVREFGTVASSSPGALNTLEGKVTSTWEADGHRYHVSEDIAGDQTSFPDFHHSPMNRVLVNHYLCQCGYSGQVIDTLVVGLPMSQYHGRDGRESDNVRLKRDNLLKPVIPVGDTPPPPIIKRVMVRPQGMSAFVNMVVGWDRKGIMDKMPERVAIIDIGGRTTDLAYILGGAVNNSEQSGSLQIGVIDVKRALNSMLQRDLNTNREFPPSVLDRAIRDRVISYKGNKVDVSDQVTKAITEFATRIQHDVDATMRDTDLADVILLVGGGASVFQDALQRHYSGAIVPDGNPSWSNVCGLWKIGSLDLR